MKVPLALSKGPQTEPTPEVWGGKSPLIPWSSETPGERGARDTFGRQACEAAFRARHNMPFVELEDLTRFQNRWPPQAGAHHWSLSPINALPVHRVCCVVFFQAVDSREN